jgi:hypothetical protein
MRTLYEWTVLDVHASDRGESGIKVLSTTATAFYDQLMPTVV